MPWKLQVRILSLSNYFLILINFRFCLVKLFLLELVQIRYFKFFVCSYRLEANSHRNKKVKDLDLRKDEIREKFAEYLHLEQTRETQMFDSEGFDWTIKYQKGPSRIDQDVLIELIGQEKVNQAKTQSEFLELIFILKAFIQYML